MEALEVFHQLLRESPNANSIYDAMIPAFGDSAEVISFFGNLVEKSTSVSEGRAAFVELKRIRSLHFIGFLNRFHSGRDNIENAICRALNNPNVAIQFSAATYLPLLGRKHEKEAREFLERRLREPLPPLERDRDISDALTKIIIPLIDSARPQDQLLLRDATKKNSLLEFFETLAQSHPNNYVSIYTPERLRKWKLAMTQ